MIGALAVSLLSNSYFMFKHSAYWRTAFIQRKALYELAERETKKPAIVFIHGFLGDVLVLSEEDAVRNHPHLYSSILYAHDLGMKNRELQNKYPDRHYYLGSYDRAHTTAHLEPLTTN